MSYPSYTMDAPAVNTVYITLVRNSEHKETTNEWALQRRLKRTSRNHQRYIHASVTCKYSMIKNADFFEAGLR